jgi:hypothetical protein
MRLHSENYGTIVKNAYVLRSVRRQALLIKAVVILSCTGSRLKGIRGHYRKEAHYVIYSRKTISGAGTTSGRGDNGVVGDRPFGCDPVPRVEAK